MTLPDDPFLQDENEPTDILAPYRRGSLSIGLRSGASREEVRTHQEFHRQALTLKVERAIAALSAMNVSDLEKVVERVGLEIMQHSQDTMSEAEATLNPEYLRMFQVFAHRSLGNGVRDILELQALAGENIKDIIADSANFRELPPEKKSLLERLIGHVFGDRRS